MASFNSSQKGEVAEREACQFLQTKGLRLLTQNYRCYFGEIDLIMQDQDDIVFIEVRSRRRIDYGNALESINKTKRAKLIKTAIHFLQCTNQLHKTNSRFDVIAIHPIHGKMQLEWIRNAFSVEDN
ncbi:MAG: YraN family protein [Gammaproteobacteria bacterium]|nr:YraN family protein [Gammaproteobacteria bacterium]